MGAEKVVLVSVDMGSKGEVTFKEMIRAPLEHSLRPASGSALFSLVEAGGAVFLSPSGTPAVYVRFRPAEQIHGGPPYPDNRATVELGWKQEGEKFLTHRFVLDLDFLSDDVSSRSYARGKTASSGQSSFSPEALVGAEDDIREAVFLYQFAHNASGLQRKAGTYFLQLGERPSQNPTDKFMERFKTHKPPVKKVSESALGEDSSVKDKETGDRGLIFRVTEIKWLSKEKVEVKGGYYEGNVSASENTYTVEFRNGRWTVTEDRLDFIS